MSTSPFSSNPFGGVTKGSGWGYDEPTARDYAPQAETEPVSQPVSNNAAVNPYEPGDANGYSSSFGSINPLAQQNISSGNSNPYNLGTGAGAGYNIQQQIQQMQQAAQNLTPVNYNTMPDQATIDMLTAQGKRVNIVQPTQTQTPGTTPVSYPTYNPDALGSQQFPFSPAGGQARSDAMSEYQRGYSLSNAQAYLQQGLKDWEANAARYKALGLPVPPKPTLEQYLVANGPTAAAQGITTGDPYRHVSPMDAPPAQTGPGVGWLTQPAPFASPPPSTSTPGPGMPAPTTPPAAPPSSATGQPNWNAVWEFYQRMMTGQPTNPVVYNGGWGQYPSPNGSPYGGLGDIRSILDSWADQRFGQQGYGGSDESVSNMLAYLQTLRMFGGSGGGYNLPDVYSSLLGGNSLGMGNQRVRWY